jgi:hypothetical protein
MVLHFGNKVIIKYVAMCSPIFGSEYRRLFQGAEINNAEVSYDVLMLPTIQEL